MESLTGTRGTHMAGTILSPLPVTGLIAVTVTVSHRVPPTLGKLLHGDPMIIQ